MATILIHNTKPRIHTIGIRTGKEAEDIKDLKLMPGVNEVDAELWGTAVKQNKMVRTYIEEEDFLILDGSTLRDMKPAAAKKLVADTVDRDLLKKWLDEEKRPGVVDAIQEQMEKVKPDGKPPADANPNATQKPYRR